MKKLFILLIFTLLSVSLIGQEIGMGGVADYFSQKSAREWYDIHKKNGMETVYLESTFSFTASNKQYLVSYDITDLDKLNSSDWSNERVRTRKLYLYCLTENGWKLALDEPLRNDFKMSNGLCNYYYPRFHLRGFKGGALVQENGIVILNIIIIYNELSSLSKTQYKVEEIKLLPIGDDMYKKL